MTAMMTTNDDNDTDRCMMSTIITMNDDNENDESYEL